MHDPFLCQRFECSSQVDMSLCVNCDCQNLDAIFPQTFALFCRAGLAHNYAGAVSQCRLQQVELWSKLPIGGKDDTERSLARCAFVLPLLWSQAYRQLWIIGVGRSGTYQDGINAVAQVMDPDTCLGTADPVGISRARCQLAI